MAHDDQPTLPGMERTPPRAPKAEAATPASSSPRAPAPAGYDDTARGFVGVPHSRTETSKKAAETIHPLASKQRRRVWEYVHEQGAHGATVDEVSVALNLPTNSVTPRFWELRKFGYLVKTADKRDTRYGVGARVHIALEQPARIGPPE